jgi:RNA polymerase sigma factor (sigma-70 family)
MFKIELLTMVKESDNKQKLKTFFSEDYLSLRSYVRSRIRNSSESDTDDIIQEVAVKLFERADNLAPIKNIAGFVYRSIRNKIIDTLRSNNSKSNFDDRLEELTFEFTENFLDKSDDPFSDEIKTELYHAISDLKPKYKEIIYAINFEGYTFKKLSKEKNIPVGTLLSRHHRALALLAQKLEKFRNKQ